MSDISLIGCRISIISKAKIRYEGYLHSVDCDTPNEPVITLSKVWSFGTEDRPCERPVAPRNEEYKQVVFRGRDLEDVRLVQSSVFLNQDSAIVSAAPGSSASQSTSADKFHNDLTSNDHLLSGTTAPVIPSMSSDTVSLDMLSRGSPSVSQAFTITNRPGPIGTLPSDRQPNLDSRGPRPFGDGRSDVDTGIVSSALRGLSGQPNQSDSFFGSNNSRTVVGSNTRNDSTDQWGSRTNRPREQQHDFYSRNVGVHDIHHQSRRAGFNQWSTNQRFFRHPPGGFNRRGPRSGGYYSHGGRPKSDFTSLTSPTTFTGEYDYEKANEELAAELEKITISVGKSNSSVDGDAGKGDESNSSAIGEDVTYDKSKSFFDTLSSELMDKANGVTSQRMNRRDERLLNSTTFGTVPKTYSRHRGGHGYYRRPSGVGYGGYRQRKPMGFPRQFGPSKGSYNAAPELSTTSDAK